MHLNFTKRHRGNGRRESAAVYRSKAPAGNAFLRPLPSFRDQRVKGDHVFVKVNYATAPGHGTRLRHMHTQLQHTYIHTYIPGNKVLSAVADGVPVLLVEGELPALNLLEQPVLMVIDD